MTVTRSELVLDNIDNSGTLCVNKDYEINASSAYDPDGGNLLFSITCLKDDTEECRHPETGLPLIPDESVNSITIGAGNFVEGSYYEFIIKI